MAGFGWAGAAQGAQNATNFQQKQASDLEAQLAEIAYRQALIEQAKTQDARLREQMDMQREQFDWNRSQAETEQRQKTNDRGVASMVFEGIRTGEATPKVGRLMLGQEGVISPTQALEGLDPTAADPFTLGPGQTRYGADGQVIAQSQAQSADTADPFTLSPGQIRYGADGKPIAHGAPQRTAGTQPRRVTSGDVTRITDLDSALSDLDVLDQEIGTTGAASKIGAMVPNVVTELTGWGADAKARQGVIDRVKQVIGKTLEGGVLRREDEYKYTKILPTIGDPPSVAASKLKGLRTAVEQRKGSFLDSLEDAEYNVENFRARGAANTPDVGHIKTFPNGRRGRFDGKVYRPID